MGVVPIVALDVPSRSRAEELVSQLGDRCTFYKIGGELFTAEGPAVVNAVRDVGADVFLDLKFHDIPNTVRAAARSAARLGARLITVHASGGAAMLRAAVEGAGDLCGVLAVTILTSMDDAALGEAWGRHDAVIQDEVLRLSDLARAAGAHGVVCSGQEAPAIHDRHGSALRLLVPGVRLAGGEAHDQKRVVTPAGAAHAGASYIVLGRAVTGEPDPAEAMQRVWQELRVLA
jgi:orotidine-5'-phosphate decarboxylase